MGTITVQNKHRKQFHLATVFTAMQKIIQAFIHSNIYISLAAVFLTVSAQIQLGMKPQWHPYLFIIFFATLFEYNLHRLITVITNKEALNSEKHRWVRENLIAFYVLVSVSVAGFGVVALLANPEVLYTLAPFAVITLFYSVPVFENRKHLFRLREIPYLKIFLIAIVWSATTILLPIVQSGGTFGKVHVAIMLAERFFFLLAITIPFDIRDLEADRHSGLKTIPLLLNEKGAMYIAYLSLLLFILISVIHYRSHNDRDLLLAMAISALTTFIFLKSEKIRNLTFYHYGILDGAMLLQGLLVLVFYYFTGN
ncbi:MAG: UbiA family prenyltransferase [Prolixibacteraceae bacterium]|jgi:4-hydroxybenzoate polyprenyltransferase